MLYSLAMMLMYVCVYAIASIRGAPRKFILLMKHEDAELIRSTRGGELRLRSPKIILTFTKDLSLGSKFAGDIAQHVQ